MRNPISDPKILSKFEKWKEEVPKISPNFQDQFRIIHDELSSSF